MPYMYMAAKSLGVHENVSSLCIPLAVTFNASGSVIFISSALLFLAQVSGLTLQASHLFTLL